MSSLKKAKARARLAGWYNERAEQSTGRGRLELPTQETDTPVGRQSAFVQKPELLLVHEPKEGTENA